MEEVSNFICHLCDHRNTKCRVNETLFIFRDAFMICRKLFLIDKGIMDEKIKQKSDNFSLARLEDEDEIFGCLLTLRLFIPQVSWHFAKKKRFSVEASPHSHHCWSSSWKFLR